MPDAMVVARMPQEKKDSVARKLADMGTNASSAINQLYDYIETHGRLPFGDDGNQASQESREYRAKRAARWLGSLNQLPQGNAFQEMTDERIRALRLSSRGFDVGDAQ